MFSENTEPNEILKKTTGLHQRWGTLLGKPPPESGTVQTGRTKILMYNIDLSQDPSSNVTLEQIFVSSPPGASILEQLDDSSNSKDWVTMRITPEDTSSPKIAKRPDTQSFDVKSLVVVLSKDGEAFQQRKWIGIQPPWADPESKLNRLKNVPKINLLLKPFSRLLQNKGHQDTESFQTIEEHTLARVTEITTKAESGQILPNQDLIA